VTLTVNEAFHRYVAEEPRIKEAARCTADHIRRRAVRDQFDCVVSQRVKDVGRYVAKIHRKGYTDPWKQVTDKVGVRITVRHPGLFDPALGLVKDAFGVGDEAVQDYRRMLPGREDRFEYPRLHVQVPAVGDYTDPDGQPYECEIQIRTPVVDVWANDYHRLAYKPPGNLRIPSDVSRALYRAFALVELYDAEIGRVMEVLDQHPDFTRGNRLFVEAERIYRTFAQHSFDRELSHEVIDVLQQVIPDDISGYNYRLFEFAERYRDRLTRDYVRFGPTSDHFLEDGRYILASQPESLIIFERLDYDSFTLRDLWNESAFADTMLYDLAEIWGMDL
jgi:ppGpp synthetase/RelA/SpoT-type nucleotidyltranferase